MYKIINIVTGETVGMTDEVIYIRRKESSGSLVKANPSDAEGIAYRSVPYNLSGRDGVGAEITVVLSEIDAAEEIQVMQEAIANTNSTIGGERTDRLYEVGERFTLNGKLYKVTLQIPAGGMIAVGANVEETDIATELSKLN